MFYKLINDIMSVKDQLLELIEVKKQLKVLEEREKEIKASILEEDFEKESVDWVDVMKKQRATITLSKTADLKTIRLQYPDLCNTIHWLDVKKLTSNQFEEIKSTYPEAYYEDISVDAKKLHEQTKEYTEQKVTTYIEVKWI